MKISFNVYGTNEATLRSAAKPILEEFVDTVSEGWTHEIEAEAITTHDGKITGWKGTVTASKEDKADDLS